MSKSSKRYVERARMHRMLVTLAHIVQYKKYGPLVGPKEAHQPDFRW